MTIELRDMDVEYRVMTDINANGKDCVRINVSTPEPKIDLCLLHLDKEQCLELARVLMFVANELKED